MQVGSEGGGRPTIQRGKAEDTQNKGDQMGEDPRQYREERRRLYETSGIKGAKIHDNRGYTKQVGSVGGRIRDYTERNCRGYTKQKGSDGGGSPRIQRRKVEAIRNRGGI